MMRKLQQRDRYGKLGLGISVQDVNQALPPKGYDYENNPDNLTEPCWNCGRIRPMDLEDCPKCEASPIPF